ncbi:MAG: hypothetical protein HFJ27_02610 [Clostridia bacterium]|nr:hypothetical protein [Clostridia bacterium]
MENLKNTSYIIQLLTEIQKTTIVLSQNQTILFDEFKALNEKVDNLDKKIDDRYAKLDKKIDDIYTELDKKINDNYAKLNKKIDDCYAKLDKKIDDIYTELDKKINDNYAKLDKKIDDCYAKIDLNRRAIFRIENILSLIQKDVKDLRTDIDTVYDLEKDSRQKLKHLL